MEKVYLLLGANLADRQAQLSKARAAISARVGVVTATSRVYESQSWGGVGEQPNYLNQVICVSCDMEPLALLHTLQQIETDLGRVRTVRWGARVIDIDILFFGERIVALPELQIPHPQFPARAFAMLPMCELAPDLRHPENGKSINELLQASVDPLWVRSWTNKTSG